ncbi:hypothetical protein L6R49_25230 [Myxococcota bacterium]|nr:hypothetical protein [Myxococcota bacterium]
MLIALCLTGLAFAEEPPSAPPASGEPAAEPSAPAPAAEPPVAAVPLGSGELFGVTPEERAAYEEGRRRGVEAARAEDVLRPSLIAGAIGLGLAAPTVLLIGPCCGAPVLSVAALGPGVYYGGREPALPEGWQTGVPSQDLAFEQAYTGTLRSRRVKSMLIFGVTGAAAGVAVGMVGTRLVLDEWGYTW